ncbi:DUF397 domain-containing protein [Micromonospora sp. NPDC049662]|uniref:DUF397 domain-containing protein n=1 Tax=Micromonospora sp. NPDC049662 TaxID=3155397 RepID=UPI0034467799
MRSPSTAWRKSSRSDDGNCVEVAYGSDGAVGVRDSKDVVGPILEFGSAAWNAFTDSIRTGRLSG